MLSALRQTVRSALVVTLAAFIGCSGSECISCPVTITMSPEALNMRVGESGDLTVSITGNGRLPTLASCTSTQSSVATASVSDGKCRVVAVGVGSATITAKTSNDQQRSASVNVAPLPNALVGTLTLTPATSTLTVGQPGVTLVPSATTGGAGVNVTYAYSSNQPSVASVNAATGAVTPVSPGNAVITVTVTGSGSGYTTVTQTASSFVAVNPMPNAMRSVTLSPAFVQLEPGRVQQLVPNADRASNAVQVTYRYRTSDATIATVDSVAGIVTAVSPGTAVMTVTATGQGAGFVTNSVTATATIEVRQLPPALTGIELLPSPLTVTVGNSVQTQLNFQRASPAVAVQSSITSANPAVAAVDAQGRITGIAPGTAVLQVQATGSGQGFSTNTLTASFSIQVQPALPAITGLTVTPTSLSLAIGANGTLAPNATRASTAVNVAYSYSSSAATVATVSTTGVVTAVAPGTAQITVTASGSGGGFAANSMTATVAVTVQCSAATDRTPDFAFNGSIAASDCPHGEGGRIDWYRLNTPMARILQLDIAASFPNIASVSKTQGSEGELRWISNNGTVRPRYFLPVGSADIGVFSVNGATGTYSFTAQTMVETTSECRPMVVLGNMTTVQILNTDSCKNGDFPYGAFLLYAPNRSCTIEMRRTQLVFPAIVPPTGRNLDDPYLEAYGPTTGLFAANDNITANVRDARLAFANCNDPAGNYIEIQAQGYAASDWGHYQLIITFGAAGVSTANTNSGPVDCNTQRSAITNLGGALRVIQPVEIAAARRSATAASSTSTSCR